MCDAAIDLTGEGGQHLVGALQLRVRRTELRHGAGQLPGAQLQLEQVDDAVGQREQRLLLVVPEVPGLGVEDAQRPDHDVARRAQLVRGVEADVTDLPGHERVVLEAWVLRGIRHDDRLLLVQDEVAHGVLARTDGGVEAGRGDLVLLGVGDEVDRGQRHLRDLRGHLDQRHQVGARGRQEHVVAIDLQHTLLVARHAHDRPVLPHVDVLPTSARGTG